MKVVRGGWDNFGWEIDGRVEIQELDEMRGVGKWLGRRAGGLRGVGPEVGDERWEVFPLPRFLVWGTYKGCQENT